MEKITEDEIFAQKTLIAGRDYPDSYREFVRSFPDDNSCALYLEELRWPNGFICPTSPNISTRYKNSIIGFILTY